MNIYAVSSLSASIILYVLAIIVYFNNTNKFLNRIYSIQCIVIASWIMGCFGESIITNYNFLRVWDKALNVFAIFSIPTFVHTYYAILGEKAGKPVKFLYGLAIGLLLISFSPWYISDIQLIKGVRYISKPGPLYIIFIMGVVYGFCLCLYKVAKAMKTNDDRKKLQLTYVMMATGSMFIAALIYLAMVLDIAVSPLDNTLNSVYGILIAYAIVKHNLMDIKVFIKKSVVFASLLCLAFSVVVGITFITQELIAGGRLIGLAISTFIIVLIFAPLEKFLINITDRYLFQKKYNPADLIRTFSKDVLRVLDINVLVRMTTDTLVKIIRIETCGLLLRNRDGNLYETAAAVGLGDNWRKIHIRKDNEMVNYLKSTKTYIRITNDDFATPNNNNATDTASLKAVLAIPILIHGDLIGILTLGRKRSDESYSRDDIELLLMLADALGIAISNALNFEDIRQKEKLATIGTMTAGIKHDIGTPINKTSAAVQKFLIEREFGDHKKMPSEEVISNAYDLLARCQMTFEKVSNIAAKFADFAKPKRKAEVERIKLSKSVNDAIGILEREIQAKNITVTQDIPDSLPSVVADRDYIQQILFNIIRNGAQAIEEANRTKENAIIEIKGSTDKSGNILIEISDTGAGISAEEQNKLFEPYYTTKPEGKGTGLGLAIVKELMERNNGTISVKSAKGQGTTFILQFPGANHEKTG